MSNNPLEQLQDEFHEAMVNVYRRAKDEADYNATRFLQMLGNSTGVETAKQLIPNMSEGFTALWEKGHLGLTVEALIVDNCKFHKLFSPEEIETCHKRLQDCGYEFPDPTK